MEERISKLIKEKKKWLLEALIEEDEKEQLSIQYILDRFEICVNTVISQFSQITNHSPKGKDNHVSSCNESMVKDNRFSDLQIANADGSNKELHPERESDGASPSSVDISNNTQIMNHNPLGCMDAEHTEEAKGKEGESPQVDGTSDNTK